MAHLEEFVERAEKIFGPSFKCKVDLTLERFTIHSIDAKHVFTIHIGHIVNAYEEKVSQLEARLRQLLKQYKTS